MTPAIRAEFLEARTGGLTVKDQARIAFVNEVHAIIGHDWPEAQKINALRMFSAHTDYKTMQAHMLPAPHIRPSGIDTVLSADLTFAMMHIVTLIERVGKGDIPPNLMPILAMRFEELSESMTKADPANTSMGAMKLAA